MSQSKSSRPRPDSTMTVVVLAEELTSYIFQITANEKQFPKAYRYTLISEMRNKCLKINEKLYIACMKKPSSEKDFKRVFKAQDKILEYLLELKALITIAADIANPHNPTYLAELYDDTVESYKKWLKNQQRLYRKMIWKRDTPADVRVQQHLDATARRLAPTMDHDNDGFVVLKKKHKKEDDFADLINF